MARLFPFPGLRYNTEMVSDLAQVICPPYDIISPQAKKLCHRRHQYNIVRIEGGETPDGGGDQYTQARDLLQRWLKQGVLKLEASPALYLHHHLFTLQGDQKLRRGIFAAVGLGDKDIHPHEETQAKPKEDRLRLLRATRANISPIFVLYHEKAGEIASIMAQVEVGPPLLSLEEENGEGHRLWAISQPPLISRLQALFSSLPLFIADGHHRYETALNYLKERGAGDEAATQAMMALVEIHDPGLVVFPIHRLLRGLNPQLLAKLESGLKVRFDLRPTSREELLRLSGQKANSGLGLAGLGQDLLIQPRPGEKPLDLVSLHQIVLEGILGWGKTPGLEITYTPDEASALSRVESGEYQLAFLVNPLPVERLLEVVSRGERLPSKATYFYPKLPTGLVLRLL